LVASDNKRQILATLSHERVFPKEPVRHTVVNCPLSILNSWPSYSSYVYNTV